MEVDTKKTAAELPTGWKLTTIGEIFKLRGGGTPDKKMPHYWNGNIPWASVKDIKNDYQHTTIDNITAEGLKNSSATLALVDELILISRISPGVSSIVKKEMAINQDLKVVTCPESMPPEFAHYLFKTLKEEIISLSSGTTVLGIRLTELKNITFALPPLNEQKRIVAKIEELFSELDAGEQSLRDARQQLTLYRQSLLKQAFEGKLTEAWRATRQRLAGTGYTLEDVVPEATDTTWFVYIIQCDDESFYVGYTSDLRVRWNRHCDGTGAEWTQKHPPRYLYHFEILTSKEEAEKREKDLKTGFGRTWRKREIEAARMKALLHNPKNKNTEPVRGEALQTGKTLLARIQQERESRHQQQLQDWQQAIEEWEQNGKESKKPSKPRKLKDFKLVKESYKQVDCSTWIQIELSPLIDEPSYGTSKKCTENPASHGVLRIPNIAKGYIDSSDLKYSDFDIAEATQHQLIEGDILLIRSNGSVSLVGKCAAIRTTDEKYLYAGYLIRLRPTKPLIDTEFLKRQLESTSLRNQIENSAKSTSGVNNINAKEIQQLAISLCPLPEQQEIVRLLDEQFTAIEQNEKEIDQSLTQSQALRQSILKKAFEGKLI
jgi:restriction endonuclease S subunit/predicted GIY-YIG superfamily endonuclease